MGNISRKIRNFLHENPIYYLFWSMLTIMLLLSTFCTLSLSKDGLKWREEHEGDSTEVKIDSSESIKEIDCSDARKLKDLIKEKDSDLDDIEETIHTYEYEVNDLNVIYILDEAKDDLTYERNYRKAQTYLDEKEYEKALSTFCTYPDYRNSLKYIIYILYYRGSDSMIDKNKLIEDHDPYIDIVYTYAEKFYDMKIWENAKYLYSVIGGYKDSQSKVKVCSDNIFLEDLNNE